MVAPCVVVAKAKDVGPRWAAAKVKDAAAPAGPVAVARAKDVEPQWAEVKVKDADEALVKAKAKAADEVLVAVKDKAAVGALD